MSTMTSTYARPDFTGILKRISDMETRQDSAETRLTASESRAATLEGRATASESQAAEPGSVIESRQASAETRLGEVETRQDATVAKIVEHDKPAHRFKRNWPIVLGIVVLNTAITILSVHFLR